MSGDLAVLVAGQRRILEAAARFVAPGGVLVYSVCTINPDEGAGVVEEFLRSHREFVSDDLATILPDACGAVRRTRGRSLRRPTVFPTTMTIPDGFYIARMHRK